MALAPTWPSRRTSGQRQHFIRKGQVGAIKRGIRQSHRLRELTRRITRINLELMRQDALREPEPP